MHLIKLALAAFVLLLASPVFSQSYKKGFIVQTGGDTLLGWIRNAGYESLSLTVEFKNSRREASQRFSATDLRAFGFRDGDFFESHPVRFMVRKGEGWQEINGQRFLYRLEGGTMSLFELRDGQEAPLFVKKQGQPLQLLCFDQGGQPVYREVLREAVADCGPLVFPEKIKLEAAAVHALVEDYNNCAGLGKRQPLPMVQLWGFGSLSLKSLGKTYRGMGLAAETRPFQHGFASRWTLGIDYENQSYQQGDGSYYKEFRLHEAALKARFFLSARNGSFCPYGLLGTKLGWKRSEAVNTLADGQQYIESVQEENYWRFQVGAGVHARFGRHFFRLEVPFDRQVNLRLGYGIVLWK